jgi:hypothetical protein
MPALWPRPTVVSRPGPGRKTSLRFARFLVSRLPNFSDLIGNAGYSRASTSFVLTIFYHGIAKVKPEMEHGFLVRIIDRVVANARVIRGAPEAVALMGIITLGVSYFGFQHFHREGVAALNDRIASQDRLLADDRTKPRGAIADEAAAQIEKLTSLLAETQKNLSEAKSKPASVENQSRDPQRLYEDNNPIAEVQDPKLDLDARKIIFPTVASATILGTNKLYEFRNWKLACGSTRLYSMVRNGAGYDYSYSPLTCKIVGNR